MERLARLATMEVGKRTSRAESAATAGGAARGGRATGASAERGAA